MISVDEDRDKDRDEDQDKDRKRTHMSKSKTAILPCTGVGQVVGTIARQAAYEVCDEMRPDETVLVCLPALVKGVQEDIDMIRDCPVVVIEGCKEKCATYALEMQNGKVAATVYVPDVIKSSGMSARNASRAGLAGREKELVVRVAEETVKEMENLK